MMKNTIFKLTIVCLPLLFTACENRSKSVQNLIVGTWLQEGSNGYFEQLTFSDDGEVLSTYTSGGNVYENTGTYSYTHEQNTDFGVLIWNCGSSKIERYVLSLSQEYMLLATVNEGATSGYLFSGTFNRISRSTSSALSCEPSSIYDNGNGATYRLTVHTPSSWKASASEDWITVSPTTGVDNATVVVKIESGSTSEGYIKFTNSNSSIKVVVKRVRNNGSSGKENGYEYVDLGLSVKWATCNVGAEIPEDYGDYFAWGETWTKTTYSWNTYTHCNKNTLKFYKYCTNSQYGTVDNKTKLDLTDDAAKVNWGGKWRMPTESEINELLNNTAQVWTFKNYVAGCQFTSKKAGYTNASIFLPAAGLKNETRTSDTGTWCTYWSSTLSTVSPNEFNGRALMISKKTTKVGGQMRNFGLTIRPVFK